MNQMDLEQVVRNIDRRLDRVEQILPALPTREDLDRKIAPLATREELAALGQRLDARITEEAERSRTYTQVHYEDLKDDIRLLADGVVKVQSTLDQTVRPNLADHDRRITALEDARGPAPDSQSWPQAGR